MNLINHNELKKQLASGEITSLDDITSKFKNILKKVIQTASQEELTSHLNIKNLPVQILSLYTKGMSVRDIQLHLNDLYGYELSTQTISNITEKVIEKANEWQSRPLDPIYPIESLNATIKRKTKSKSSFPTIESAFKLMYLATQEQQEKWKANSIRSWYEIFPQLSIFSSEIMSKYTK